MDIIGQMPAAPSPTEPLSHALPQPAAAARTGIARGLNIQPGADDDGWEVPPPVCLGDGTVVRLLKDGEALRVWYDAIGKAKRSIFLESYIFAADGTGNAFRGLLIQKVREGVRVYVIYDSFGSHETPREFFTGMQREGVNVREFHPIAPWRCSFSWRPFNRNHGKLLIIDGNSAGLGGLNIADDYGGSWVSGKEDANPENLWRDCGIGMEGPGVAALSASFLRTWMYVSRGGRFARALMSHNLDGSDGPVGVLASVPTMGSPVSRLLSKLLREARKSIDLTSAYFAPGDELVSLLCRAARRGARVRLMLPANTDARIMLTAARSFYEQLLAAGVEVYERQYVKLHAKTLSIDGEISLLGSTNFDYRSIDYNCEITAVLRSREFGGQMLRLFEHDVKFSSRISSGEWRHRPLRDRLAQWVVKRSRTLL